MKDKMTIYLMSRGEKIFCTITLTLGSLFFFLPLEFMSNLEWQAILGMITPWILLFYLNFVNLFSRIVFDGEQGVLKLCDFWVRRIPLQDIKVVERDDYIYGRGSRKGLHCWIYVELINGKKKRIGLSVPFFGRKRWLDYVDGEIGKLNKYVDEWYMEYRKQNKNDKRNRIVRGWDCK